MSLMLDIKATSTTHNDMKDKFTEAIRLMKLDLAYFEEKYQGKFLESCCSYCLPLRFVHEQQGND